MTTEKSEKIMSIGSVSSHEILRARTRHHCAALGTSAAPTAGRRPVHRAAARNPPPSPPRQATAGNLRGLVARCRSAAAARELRTSPPPHLRSPAVTAAATAAARYGCLPPPCRPPRWAPRRSRRLPSRRRTCTRRQLRRRPSAVLGVGGGQLRRRQQLWRRKHRWLRWRQRRRRRLRRRQRRRRRGRRRRRRRWPLAAASWNLRAVPFQKPPRRSRRLPSRSGICARLQPRCRLSAGGGVGRAQRRHERRRRRQRPRLRQQQRKQRRQWWRRQ